MEKSSQNRKNKAVNIILSIVFIPLFVLCLAWALTNVHPMGASAAAKTPAATAEPVSTPEPAASATPAEEVQEEIEPAVTPEPKKHYVIPEGALAGPAPDESLYGTVSKDSPEDMLPVIEKAREYGLLEEDEYVVFDPGAEFYKGLYSDDIKYYLDETIFAVLWKEVIDGKSCSLAEVKIADASQLRRKLADDTFGGYNQYYASDMAVSANAVVAMNADYYLFRDFGIVIYDRELKRFNTGTYLNPYLKYNCIDSLFINSEGDFLYKTILEENTEESIKQFAADNDILFSLAFGPVLVKDGQAQTCDWYPLGEIDVGYSRAGIGQVGKLHYLWMSVNHGDVSGSWTINEFAQHFAEKNVDSAYCLDGGQTGEVVFQGAPYNHVDFGAERTVSDIIYFASAIPEDERSAG